MSDEKKVIVLKHKEPTLKPQKRRWCSVVLINGKPNPDYRQKIIRLPSPA